MSSYLLKCSLYASGLSPGSDLTGASSLEKACFGLAVNGEDLHIATNIDANGNVDINHAAWSDKLYPFMTPTGLSGLTNFCLIAGLGFSHGAVFTGELQMVVRPVAPPGMEESGGSSWETTNNFLADSSKWGEIPEAYGQTLNAATPTDGPFFYLGQDCTGPKVLCGPYQIGWYLKNSVGVHAGDTISWGGIKILMPLGGLFKLG